ncbi:uncharacterized protein LOC131949205 [Physella acuta]|uniref:uncharacterized protein LOC131949205 n=1 Tax=Physella acuta TaxID=109671 RepID=UPI0027DBC357|nr:uncharacterized protein LOC131949205 [Physella acuta]
MASQNVVVKTWLLSAVLLTLLVPAKCQKFKLNKYKMPYAKAVPVSASMVNRIEITGTVPSVAKDFTISLCRTISCYLYMPLTLKVSFTKGKIIRNSKGLHWSKEESSGGPMPINLGQRFRLNIALSASRLQISVADMVYANYTLTMPLYYTRYLTVQGNVTLTKIKYIIDQPVRKNVLFTSFKLNVIVINISDPLSIN